MKFEHLILLTAIIVPVSYNGKSANAALTFAQTVVQDGAIAYWQLNDTNTSNGATAVSTVNPVTYNGKYQSGNQLGDGVTTGAAPFPAMGTAAYFHNTTSNTTLANSDAVIAPATGLPAGDADRTIIFWEKDSLTNQQGFYQIQADYGTPSGVNGNTNFNGSFIPTIYPNTSGQGLTNYGSTLSPNSPAINDGNWHFIAITAQAAGQGPGNTLYSIYVDGSTTPLTDMNAQNTILDKMTIGSATVVDLGSPAVVGWNGGLSNVAVFDTVLTSGPNGQIQTLYANAANVPEPVSLGLMSLTMIGLMVRRRGN